MKACINGARTPDEHPRLPVTAEQLAADVAAVELAGADAVHLHVKDAAGDDTLEAAPLAAVLTAVGDAAPRMPVGVTTGAWASAGPQDRVAAVRSWTVLPGFASVNWHEDGAEEVAAALLDRGVGVEAGLYHDEAVTAWAGSPFRDRCLRVLLELPDGLNQTATGAMANRLLGSVRDAVGDTIPVVLHGEGSSCWPALQHAAILGVATRIGLEDTLELPDCSPAPDNATLVRSARRLLTPADPNR